MEKFEEYLNRAKDIAEDAGEAAKDVMGEVVSRAKELTEEGSKARELVKNAKDQASAASLSVKEKIQEALQDSKAGKEFSPGIAELEALPEFEGSILYTMELQSLLSDLRRLDLIISDDRMDKASVEEEIKKVITKVQPASDVPEDDAEQQAIEKAKDIAFNACLRALDTLS